MRYFRFVMAISVLLPTLALFADEQPSSAQVPRIAAMAMKDDETIGHKYLGNLSAENLNRLRDSGINTVALWIGYPGIRAFSQWEWWNDSRSIGELEEIAERCKTAGLDLYFVCYIGLTWDYYQGVQFTPSKDMAGKGDRLPSWIDPEYWKSYVIPRDRRMAELVAQGLAKGILLEGECYQEGARFDIGGFDFGDAAFIPFLRQVGMEGEKEVEVSKRAEFLYTNGYLPAFIEWQQQELRNRVSDWKSAIHSIAPQAQLGMYMPGRWYGAWAHRTIGQTLTDPERPLLILDANTYAGVGHSYQRNLGVLPLDQYSEYVTTMLADWNVNAHVVFGIFTHSNANYRQNEFWSTAPCATSKGIRQFLRESNELRHGFWIWNEDGDPGEIIKDLDSIQLDRDTGDAAR